MHNVHVGMHVLGDKGENTSLYSKHTYYVAFLHLAQVRARLFLMTVGWRAESR